MASFERKEQRTPNNRVVSDLVGALFYKIVVGCKFHRSVSPPSGSRRTLYVIEKVKMKHNISLRMLLALHTTLLLSSAYATTYYVSSSVGNDSWNGLYATSQGGENGPWKTIGKANGFSLSAGDTVCIRAGNYTESIRPSNSGNSNAYITFKNYTNEEVVITGNVSPAIELSNRSYIIVDGIKATDVRRYVRAENAKYTIVRNCRFESAAANASYTVILYTLGADYNQFINNYASGGSDLINIRQNSNHNLIAGNEFYSASHAIFAIRTGSYNIIKNNYFHNDKNKIGEIYNYCDELGYDTIPTEHNLIEKNVFAKTTGDDDNSPEAGIQFAGQNCIIRRNVFYDNVGGINLALYPGTNCINYPDPPYEAGKNYENRIYNNVFYANTHAGICTNEWDEAEFYDNVIKNNIFQNNNLQLETNDISFWNNMEGEPIQFMFGRVEFIFENNDILTPSSKEDWAAVAGDRSALLNPANRSIAQWETDYSDIFKNNVQLAPGFVDPNNLDFHLQASSAVIDKGAFLTHTISQGSGTTIPLEDARYFCDGFNITGELGDVIQLAGQSQTARITDVDFTNNSVTVDNTLTWSESQGVSLAYNDAAPDIGAYEYDGINNTKDNYIGENFGGNTLRAWPQNVHVAISFTVPKALQVHIKFYDVMGKCITQFVCNALSGDNTVKWNRHSDFGNPVAAGCYIVKLQYVNSVFIKRFVLF